MRPARAKATNNMGVSGVQASVLMENRSLRVLAVVMSSSLIEQLEKKYVDFAVIRGQLSTLYSAQME